MNISKNKWSVVFICAILAFFTLALFWPLLRCDFINFDDPEYVYQNSHIEAGLTWQAVVWAFKSGYTGNWHPVTWLSHMLDVQLFGLNPGWHHLTNLLFHILNTLLLFLVLNQMTAARWRSAFVAALFALHPLHVESVAWIAERKDVLSTCFFLLTLWAYAGFVQAKLRTSRFDSGTYLLALLFFGLGLMSKPMLVTTPFVLLLLDFWPLGRFQTQASPLKVARRLLPEKIPFFGMAVSSCAITFIVQDKQGAVTGISGLPLGLRIENAIVAYFRYLQKTFWPTDLAVFYPHPESRYPIISDQWPLWIVICIGLVLLAVSILTILARRKFPQLAFGWFWYLGTLVPVIGLVQVGGQAMADRYTYIPLIGIFILVAWSVGSFFDRWHFPKNTLVAISIASLAWCAFLTRTQLSYWQDSISIFTHTLECTKDNATAHFNFGEALAANRNYDAAIKHYVLSLEIDPTYADAHYNMGHALANQGKLAEAAEHYQKVFAFKPNHLFAHNNLGNVLLGLGRTDEAIKQYREALRLKPDYPSAHYNLGKVLAEQSSFDEAIAHYTEALRLKPNYAEALTGLGLARALQGNLGSAMVHLREVTRLKPDNAEAHVNLGNVLTDAGKTNEARIEFKTAAKLQPNFVEKQKQAAKTFLQKGKLDAALARYTIALRLNPSDAEVHEQLGSLLAQLGQLSEAREHFESVVKLRPDDAQGYYNLALTFVMQGKSEEAVPFYRETIRQNPTNSTALNDLAWILATHSKAEIRNGNEAVQLAQRACDLTQNREPRFLGTLDAALAETGQFEKAIQTAEKARELALARGENDIVQAAEKRIALYRSKKPSRQK